MWKPYEHFYQCHAARPQFGDNTFEAGQNRRVPFAVPDHRRKQTELSLGPLWIIDSFICLELSFNGLKQQADIAFLVCHRDAMCNMASTDGVR